MSPQVDTYSRIAVIIFQIMMVVLLGYITWTVRHSLKFWQGVTRASLMMYVAAGAYGTMAVIYGWNPSPQIILRLVALGCGCFSLAMTIKDNRQNPQDGITSPSAG